MGYKNKLQINHYFHLNYRKLQPIPVNIHSSIDYMNLKKRQFTLSFKHKAAYFIIVCQTSPIEFEFCYVSLWFKAVAFYIQISFIT